MHLHNHTNFSVIDGRGLIEDYVKLAVQDGQESIAVTDHGTLGGVIDAYQICKKAGIKLIVGCELYVDAVELRERDYPRHLTVLAKNESGYRALIAANNLAHRQFYYRPRLTLRQIIEQGLAKDWFILSGCMSSIFYDYPQAEAETMMKTLAQHAGGFGLEVMWHHSEDEQFNHKQDEYLSRIASLAKTTGFPLVLTNDCHYAYKHQEDYHIELRQNAHNDKSELEFDGTGFYFKSMQGMQEIANDLGCSNAVDNAVEVSKLCNVHIPEADNISWYVPDITGGRPMETIRALTEERLGQYPPEYKERYEHELSVLGTSAAILNSYLVTHDVVLWCRDRGIPVAARGSMAGSIVSFLLSITMEDPIKYNLSFSRAVNPARPSIPDFDLDVSSIHRGAILEYLRERYEDTIPIAAYTHYGPKGALRKVLLTEGLRSPPEINEMAKPLPDDWAEGDNEYSGRTHSWIGEAEWWQNVPQQYHNFVRIYNGLFSSMSVHPSGLLVSGPERNLEHEVPLQWIASSKTLASAYDMYAIKKIGLYKLDVLGLRTLDQLAYMEQVSGAKLPDDNYDDPDVLSAFGADLLAEIFQMDGYAAREVIKQIGGIKHFEDIVAANSLARPGANQFTPHYRSGYQGLLKLYPELEVVLGYTNGLILYQEQVMEIGRVLASFDDAEQDDIKEAIKYFRKDEFYGTIAQKFRERMAPRDAEPIIEAIVKFGGYAFNRAHAMTYAAIAYKMMWYKVHYPAVYYAATFDAAGDKHRLVLESHFFGVNWHPADVNYSEFNTVVKDAEILLGLSAIKGVGPAAFEVIKERRPFTSAEDFEARARSQKCNIRVITALKDSFACSSLGVSGKYSNFNEAFGFSYRYLNSQLSQQLSNWQNEVPGFRTAGFVTDRRSFIVTKQGPNHGKEMGRAEIVNIIGKRRCVIFPDVWRKLGSLFYQGAAVRLVGESQLNGEFIVQDGEEIKI
jgi:DNA polymerase-3 subunit alpha